MVDPERTDEDLVDQIADARPEALQALYRRHGRLVYSMALKIVGDPEAAEEVAQDVFQRVWEKAATYRSEKARLITWLMRITRNRSIDVLRRGTSRGSHEQGTWDDLAGMADPAAADPGDSAEHASRQAQVRVALGALPEDQRTALALAFFQGLTHQQIAERLGEPLGTVKTRIRDAMRKLRVTLGEGVEQ